MQGERGEILLRAIYDDVDAALNPEGVECWRCGGEGETHDCFDGFCACAEEGCPDCRQACAECRIHAGARAKAVREAVIDSGDTDVAIAWLKDIGRWHDGISVEQVRTELAAARPHPSEDANGR